MSIIDFEHFYMYLAGPIDFDPSGGTQWRVEWTDALAGLGFNRDLIMSPTLKPISNIGYDADNEAELIHAARQKQDWEEMERVVGEIMHIDLRMTDKADLILAKFPKDKNGNRVFTVGTVHEIVEARRQHKPVMVVWDGGKETASGWLMTLVGHRNVFGTFEELKDRLRQIVKGETDYDTKDWLMFKFGQTHKERMIKYGANRT
jgi:hypothetical protein